METRHGFNPLEKPVDDDMRMQNFRKDYVSRRKYANPEIDRGVAINLMDKHGLSERQRRDWLDEFDAKAAESEAVRAAKKDSEKQRLASLEGEIEASYEATTRQKKMTKPEKEQREDEARKLIKRITEEEAAQKQAEYKRQQEEDDRKLAAGKVPGQKNPVMFGTEFNEAIRRQKNWAEQEQEPQKQDNPPSTKKNLFDRLRGLFN